MKSKVKAYTASNAKELAEILDLDPADAIEMEFRAKLNKKIIDAVKSEKLTHADVAKRSKSSRTRVTAILNGKTSGISTDFLLRILFSLGYTTKLSFARKSKLAA